MHTTGILCEDLCFFTFRTPPGNINVVFVGTPRKSKISTPPGEVSPPLPSIYGYKKEKSVY